MITKRVSLSFELYVLPPSLSICRIETCWFKIYNLNLLLVSSRDVGDGPANYFFHDFLLICSQKILKTRKGLMINDTIYSLRILLVVISDNKFILK